MNDDQNSIIADLLNNSDTPLCVQNMKPTRTSKPNYTLFKKLFCSKTYNSNSVRITSFYKPISQF